MAIPNTVQTMRAGVAGTLAKEGPTRVSKYILDYTFNAATENHATPSRAVCFKDAAAGTVNPGDTGGQVFAGLLLGNERVLSDAGDSWYNNGDTAEVVIFGEMFVNIDENNDTTVANQALAVGDTLYFEKATGKLMAGPDANQGNYTQIKGCVVTGISNYVARGRARLARVALTGPQE